MSRSEVCDPPANTQRWLVLILVAIGTFMSTLDVSILNVALPTLTSFFGTSVAISQWFVLSYTFTITVFLLLFGKLGDIRGRRSIYTCGIIVFVVGSLACGLSNSAFMLILARALQGIGSSMTMSTGPAFVTEGFPGRERGKAIGLIGTSVAIGLLAGPVIGGIILRFASWRWIFLINIPVGIVLAVLLATRIRGFDTGHGGKLDLPGTVLLALAISVLLGALTIGQEVGWSSVGVAVLFILFALLVVAFMRVEQTMREPMLNLSLFKNRGFVVAATTGWANYAAVMPVPVFMPFYLANVLNYQPYLVGLILASNPLVLAILAPIAGSLSDKIGYRLLTTVGLATTAVAIFSMRSLGPESTWIDVVVRLSIAGVGSALFTSPNSSAILGSVRCDEIGIASGTIALVRNLGMVSGVAIAGAIIATISKGFTLEWLRAAFLASVIIAGFGAIVSSMRVQPHPESTDAQQREVESS